MVDISNMTHSYFGQVQNGNESVFMWAEYKILSAIHHFVQCLWSPMKRLGTSRQKGNAKAGVRSPLNEF